MELHGWRISELNRGDFPARPPPKTAIPSSSMIGSGGEKQSTRPGNLTVCQLENGPVEIVVYPLKIVIFHSYIIVMWQFTRLGIY